jgi:hypothetical protein
MSTIQSFNLRTWATPLTIGSFVLMAVSGVLMFFDVVPGYLVFAHEWFSWFFLLGTAAHIAVNYRAFARHLRGGWGRAHVAVFSVLLVVSTFSFGRITAPQLKWPISEALVDAPLSALADVKRMEAAELIATLGAHGISATPEQNIRHLAEVSGLDEFHLLGLVMLSGR